MIFNYIIQNWLEIAAVIFAILYLILAVKQNILCWISGIISSILYFFIMRSAGLYMEAYLQIFYVFMGFYGWSQWKKEAINKENFVVHTWSKLNHFFALSSLRRVPEGSRSDSGGSGDPPGPDFERILRYLFAGSVGILSGFVGFRRDVAGIRTQPQ